MKNINIAPAFLLVFWVGFVCAISFMEAWLKFRAPGVTLTIGLSIGMKVFTALNRVEWVLMIITFGWILRQYSSLNFWLKFGMTTCALIIFLQSFFLLPDLTARAISLIENNPLPANPATHITYVVAETIKVTLLITMVAHWTKLMFRSNKFVNKEKATMQQENYKKVAV